MKLRSVSALVLCLLYLLSGDALAAAAYHRSALDDLASRVYSRSGGGYDTVPVTVIFDLDDTLFDSRVRTVKILKELAAHSEVRASFPVEAEALERIEPSQVRYLLQDTLREQGIVSPELVARAQSEWKTKFFSNDYCALDLPLSGAGNYLWKLVGAGATLVYLTGRDEPGMGKCTQAALTQNHFPGAPFSLTIMKPRFDMDDLVFKKEAFERIEKVGEVLGGFENEPRNINALRDRFPGGSWIFVDSIHSPRPDVPYSDIPWVRSFEE